MQAERSMRTSSAKGSSKQPAPCPPKPLFVYGLGSLTSPFKPKKRVPRFFLGVGVYRSLCSVSQMVSSLRFGPFWGTLNEKAAL